MEEQLLTKCPHCGTTFRLSKEHLEIAGGAVRCGSCYQVFHAKEHIIKTSVVEEVKQEAPKEEEAPDPFEEFELDDGDPYEETPNWSSDDHPDADLFSESYAEPTPDDATLQEFGIEPEPEEEPKPKSKEGADESWAEALLEEMGEEPEEDDDDLIQDDPKEDGNHTSNTGFGSISSSESAFQEEQEIHKEEKVELSDTFMDLNYDTFDKFGIEGSEDDSPPSQNDESWAQKMLEELESEDTPKAPSIEELSIIDDTPSEEEQAGGLFAAKEVSRNREDAMTQAREKARDEAKKQRELEKQNKNSAPKETSLDTDDSFFGDLSENIGDDIDLGDMDGLIADEPATPVFPGDLEEEDLQPAQDILEQQIAVSEIHFGEEETKKKRSGLKTVALIIFNIVAIIGLAAQHAYFNFDDLARQDSYRPYYKLVCDQLGCKLPTRVDVSKIQGANLVVRTHPMEPNAIVIDVIVYNRAKYTQPYPDLKLSFEDLNGKPVAARRFKPKEYIQDSKINFDRMPPNAPVHITLEIVDPGPQASNYQIDFL